MCNRYFARSCRILCMINLHCHMIDMYTHEHTHIHTQAHQHAWTCMQTHSLFSTHSHTHAQHVCISECAFVLTCTMCMNTHAWTIHEYIHVTRFAPAGPHFFHIHSSLLSSYHLSPLPSLFPPFLFPPFSLPSLLSPLPSLSSPIHLPSSLYPHPSPLPFSPPFCLLSSPFGST